MQPVAPNCIELTEPRNEREKSISCIPPSIDTKPGVPAFASTSAAQRAADSFYSQERKLQSKTPRPTAGELDQGLREEAAAGNSRAPAGIFGPATQEFEPFASEGPSLQELGSLRKAIALGERYGKSYEMIEEELSNHPSNRPELKPWIKAEVDKARRAAEAAARRAMG